MSWVDVRKRGRGVELLLSLLGVWSIDQQRPTREMVASISFPSQDPIPVFSARITTQISEQLYTDTDRHVLEMVTIERKVLGEIPCLIKQFL